MASYSHVTSTVATITLVERNVLVTYHTVHAPAKPNLANIR